MKTNRYIVTENGIETVVMATGHQKAANAFFKVKRAIRSMHDKKIWVDCRSSENNPNRTATIVLEK